MMVMLNQTVSNNNNHDDIYSAVIMADPLREFTRFTRWIQNRRQVAADLWTSQPTWATGPPMSSQSPFIIITQPESW